MRLFTALVAAGLLLCLANEPLFAQTKSKPALSPKAKLSSDRTVLAPTIDLPPRLTRQLAPAQRLQLLNSARAVARLPPVSTPPASTTRVSVAAARSPAGARIVLAKANRFGGPNQQYPDGYLSMTAAGPNGGGDFVELNFPAQSGKHYVLDCAVQGHGEALPVRFSKALGGDMTETAMSVDDHVMVVVRADGTDIRRVLQSPATHWWWSACDIAPIN